MTRRIRMVAAACCTTIATLALAAPVLAATNDGEGLVGETNDKIVTFVSLGVLVFFIALVTIGTIIQNKLEKRKDARKAARLRQRIGW